MLNRILDSRKAKAPNGRLAKWSARSDRTVGSHTGGCRQRSNLAGKGGAAQA